MKGVPQPKILDIADLLRQQSLRAPNSFAIRAPGRRPLTYARLKRQTDEVLRALRAAGVRLSSRVAMVLPNGPETAVVFLSVGAAAIAAPLNPALTRKEFEFYLSDIGADVVILRAGDDSPARAVAKAFKIRILELSPRLEAEAGLFSLRVVPSPSRLSLVGEGSEDVALVLYTSGTTSRPKMVPLTHSNILASAGNIAASLQLSENDRCLNMMPLFHIHGLVGGVIAPLMAGGSVVCPSGFDAEEFFSWLEEFRPTWYTAVPTIHQAVLSSVDAHREEMRRCSLRLIRSSSAALPLRVKEGLEEVFGVPVIEAYGMTEAAHQITSNPLPPGERKAGSVGLPTGTEVAVMNDDGHFISRGAVGEIAVRGPSVIAGYANDSDANNGSFEDGWLRTGDLGYFDADGYLFLAGRIKEIVNRGGEKISPREVEEVLVAHPDIREAVAFAVPHPSLGEDIAAAIVPRDKARVTEPLIREYLLGRVAEFKTPSRLLIVDDIPKGATGKVNRTELAERFAEQLAKEFIEPDHELERVVARIYGDVLGIERISASDNFFALGGDSLRATQVLNRVRALFQVNLSIATIFRKATVSDLAHEIVKAIEAPDANQ